MKLNICAALAALAVLGITCRAFVVPSIRPKRLFLQKLHSAPFKSGRHTYNSWSVAQEEQEWEFGEQEEGREYFDDEYDDYDTDEDEEYIDRRESRRSESTGGRGGGRQQTNTRRSTRPTSRDREVEEYEQGVKVEGFQSNNGLVVWLRKIYDAMFFYGLDIPDAPSKRRRRNAASSRSREDDHRREGTAPGPDGNIFKIPKKNPFMTESEMEAESIFSSFAEEQDRREREEEEDYLERDNLERDQRGRRMQSRTVGQFRDRDSRDIRDTRPVSSSRIAEAQAQNELEFDDDDNDDDDDDDDENRLDRERVDSDYESMADSAELPVAEELRELDRRLGELGVELQALDEDISRAVVYKDSESSGGEGMGMGMQEEQLREEKTLLMQKIENIQITYVTLSSEL